MFGPFSLVLLVVANALACTDEQDDELLVQDPNMYEGDIELTREQKMEMAMEEAGIPTFSMRIGREWPNPKAIPYVIDGSLRRSRAAVRAIDAAMRDFSKFTCLRFRRRRSNEKNYIRFTDGKGCYSLVGMNTKSYNRIQLKDGCRTKGKVLHEMMHTLGFWHEQSRPDRDEYVIINRSNIKPEFLYAFKKQTYDRVNSAGSPYDYESITHYGKHYFAKDKSKLTIITKDKRYQNKIGQRKQLSKQDIIQLNVRYCGASKKIKSGKQRSR